MPRHNPEKRTWRGVSHKNGKRVKDLKEQEFKDMNYDEKSPPLHKAKEDSKFEALCYSGQIPKSLLTEKDDLVECIYCLRMQRDRHKAQSEKYNNDVNKLKDLLAVIHRDGGHYTDKHGLTKSVEDALLIHYRLRSFKENLIDGSKDGT